MKQTIGILLSRIAVRLSILVWASIWLQGCAGLGKALVEKPKVQLENVKVAGLDGSGGKLLFLVKVENPNGFALKVDSVRYDIELENKAFSSGKIETPTEVAANSSRVVEIPIAFLYRDLFTGVMDFVSRKRSSYRIKGAASVGVFNVPFDEKGELKLEM